MLPCVVDEWTQTHNFTRRWLQTEFASEVNREGRCKNKAEKFASYSSSYPESKENLVVAAPHVCVRRCHRQNGNGSRQWRRNQLCSLFPSSCFIICEMTIQEIKRWRTYRRVNCERMITNWKVFRLPPPSTLEGSILVFLCFTSWTGMPRQAKPELCSEFMGFVCLPFVKRLENEASCFPLVSFRSFYKYFSKL